MTPSEIETAILSKLAELFGDESKVERFPEGADKYASTSGGAVMLVRYRSGLYTAFGPGYSRSSLQFSVLCGAKAVRTTSNGVGALETMESVVDALHAWKVPDTAMRLYPLVEQYVTKTEGGMHWYEAVFEIKIKQPTRP